MESKTLKEKLQKYRFFRTPFSYMVKGIIMLAAIATVAIIGYILIYITAKGMPHLSLDLFKWEYTSENVSMMPAIINTLIIVVVSLLMAVPFGIGAAIYLSEYAKRGSRFVKIVRVTTETLSGIPSIIFGLFGRMFFVVALGWGYSVLASSMTLAIMVLPLILRTTEEALIAIPDTFREGSFGLGAGRLRTVFRVILPSALPAILSGVILAMGRIVGETAVLIFTAGSVAKVTTGLFSSGRTLAVHMYNLSSEGLHLEQAYATAFFMLVFVAVLNIISTAIVNKARKY